MTERKLDPTFQAYQEMPVNWYEKLSSKDLYLVAMALMIYMLATTLINKSGLNPDGIEPHLIGAFLYTIGTIADKVSTGKALDANIKVADTGITDYVFEETNPLVGKVRSSTEFYHSRIGWIKDGLGLIAGAAIPPFGIACGIIRGLGAMSNFRVAKRGNRIIELALLE